ncbi:unnamed protein product [Protopolystoma xenopodis]|uniref:Uncharacterized protein n=1 Tax=Protopolystoma xenopodis TaxID=117903 RepID=A0A3S5CCG4_9PLAT|nr:unnamed protein product [Protopolystoma xenopodis]
MEPVKQERGESLSLISSDQTQTISLSSALERPDNNSTPSSPVFTSISSNSPLSVAASLPASSLQTRHHHLLLSNQVAIKLESPDPTEPLLANKVTTSGCSGTGTIGDMSGAMEHVTIPVGLALTPLDINPLKPGFSTNSCCTVSVDDLSEYGALPSVIEPTTSPIIPSDMTRGLEHHSSGILAQSRLTPEESSVISISGSDLVNIGAVPMNTGMFLYFGLTIPTLER